MTVLFCVWCVSTWGAFHKDIQMFPSAENCYMYEISVVVTLGTIVMRMVLIVNMFVTFMISVLECS